MKKIVLIVDNPKRDLAGLSLLAYYLLGYDYEVYLVPMYDQEIHIYAIEPDLIVLNYCRIVNTRHIKKYKRLGFRIAILDTEGGIRNKKEEFVDGIELTGISNLLDLYFAWGNVPYEVFKDYFDKESPLTKLICSGSPRHDFFHNSFKEFNDTDIKNKDYILIIASFALCNPKFVSLKEEALNTVDAIGYSLELVEKIQYLVLDRMNKYLDIIEDLLIRFPNEEFVLRTHPFENDNIYIDRFSKYNNIQFDYSDNIISVLQDSKLIFQINSSVAIEAKMIGKPVIQPEYINDDIDRVEQVAKCSYLANDKNELFSIFDLLVNDKRNDSLDKQTKEIEYFIKNIISDYFYKQDGKSSIRVADEINNFIKENYKTSNSKKIKMTFILEYLKHFIKNFIKIFIKKDAFNNRKEKEFDMREPLKLLNFFDTQDIEVKEVSFYSKFKLFKSKCIKLAKKNK
jgi:surface carbohydrate biosynthesis protein